VVKYAALRITDGHVLEIGTYHSIERALGARNSAAEDGAHHFHRHAGPGGFASIVPTDDPLDLQVCLFTAAGELEIAHRYTVRAQL
jgi:hypothetical protein